MFSNNIKSNRKVFYIMLKYLNTMHKLKQSLLLEQRPVFRLNKNRELQEHI